ncbi:TetR family transcriptional regulator [Sphaerisporangium rufum]|uniref:TetR family transcriptional regulator n=1 Tax=Sphaerisporangium rufum TaxID=1381558 RepID=A0A919R671_9ACTN|nr:TetR family transcriptional regulator [Sphaerisporangium rufum]
MAGRAGDAELRADARRNRQLIIEAAQQLFLRDGADVPLEEIARRAGVGIGTLYRRFPDRNALIHAAGLAMLERLAELAESAWREEPDAWHALRRFLRGALELRLGALQSVIEPRLHAAMRAAPELREIRQRIIVLVERMIRHAHQDGALRPDVEPGDIALMMTMHVQLPGAAPDERAVRRVVEIMLDGLRAGDQPELPDGAMPIGAVQPDPVEP